MKLLIVLFLFLSAYGSSVRAETLSWRYFTGWDHGFILTMDRESSSIVLQDQKSGRTDEKVLHNPEEVFQYFAALIRKVKADRVGFYADDGPENQVVFTDEEGTIEHTIYDVSPPHLFLHWKIQDLAFPAEDALEEADRFFERFDAFLLVDQLGEIKTSYFEDSEENPFAGKGDADESGTGQESEGEKPPAETTPGAD